MQITPTVHLHHKPQVLKTAISTLSQRKGRAARDNRQVISQHPKAVCSIVCHSFSFYLFFLEVTSVNLFPLPLQEWIVMGGTTWKSELPCYRALFAHAHLPAVPVTSQMLCRSRCSCRCRLHRSRQLTRRPSTRWRRLPQPRYQLTHFWLL